VLEPEFWNGEEVREKLTECLDTVGGDGWQWSFVSDQRREFASYQPEFRFIDAPAPLVCLHNTGLDSTAGLARRLRDRAVEQTIPVLVRHQTGQAGLALKQFQILQEHYGLRVGQIQPLMVGVRVYPSKIRPLGVEDEENTQRCRSFLFASVGGVVAAAMGASSVEVYESGVGAINMPLMAGMVGSKATKGCHPRFLCLMSGLMTLIAGRKISFVLPFLEKTKAEVVGTLAEEGLDELARSTVSCVHYPLRERIHKQCGVCPACIFRRQALTLAGIEEPGDSYKYDIFGTPRQDTSVAANASEFLKAFLMQVSKLSELEPRAKEPWFLRRHLVGTGAVEDGQPLTPFVDLYRRYRNEWLALVAKARAQGWSWANLLTPRKVAV